MTRRRVHCWWLDRDQRIPKAGCGSAWWPVEIDDALVLVKLTHQFFEIDLFYCKRVPVLPQHIVCSYLSQSLRPSRTSLVTSLTQM